MTHPAVTTYAELLSPAEAPWQLDFARWPQDKAQRWRAVLAASALGRTVLLADRACDRMLLQSVESQLRCQVRWLACPPEAIDHALGAGAADFRALAAVESALPAAASDEGLEDLGDMLDNATASPVVRLLGATLHDAVMDGASDIHVECTPRGANIRFRIDGVMADVRSLDSRASTEQLVSRLKVMAELDIGERRLPQDGRFRLRLRERSADFRLSIMPSSFGEDAVVRLLDRGSTPSDSGPPRLESLGFDDEQRQALRALARQPHGLLLVTGPTGSGKTTTLYAALGEIRTGREKIITIEDPVEMQLPGVVQIPVNEKKGLTFARGLRSILRHDPDRVMVGEIRDPETAQIAVQAALTGHLVLSSVHANNPFDVIGRLMHMGLDLYNVVSALNAVLAQRLLRINCPQCARPVTLDVEQLSRFSTPPAGHRFMRGIGCGHCRGTGYKGRRAVAELLRLDDGLRDQIAARAPMSQIKATARQRGLRPLRDNAWAWVCAGHTTLEELERVTLAD